MADKAQVVAVVGADSLLGRELVDVLNTQPLPATVKHMSTVDQDESPGGILTEQEGEAVFMGSLRAGELAGARVVLLAGTPESSKKVAETVRDEANAPALIDVTGALEETPAARLRAPMLDTNAPAGSAPVYVIAHPAAITLVLFLRQLSKVAKIQRAVIQVFEPVSERGKKGLDELQQQTASLLTFQKMKTDVFDTQVSFNMLPQYGSDAVRSLEDVEAKVERHVATLLSAHPQIPMPSVRVVHAPVFHGYSMSAWVEFDNRPSKEDLAAALATAQIEVRAKDEEAPSNVGIAGQSGITVGGIVPDRNDPRACWFWIVADNLRLAADNAVEVARGLLA